MGFLKSKALWAALAVAIAAGGVWYWKSRGATEIKWRTSEVERGPLQVSVTATGTLQAVVTVQVGTQVSGTVSEINADFNSQVRKGEVIARIDTTLLRAALSDALSSQERAAAQERQAADTRARTQTLFERELVSHSELDQAVANARVAAANLSSAKAQVDRARINLRYATIVSPIDGTVLSRAVDVGQTVAASFNTPTLFTIAGDLSQMQVQASVDEADIGKVKAGQRATFTVDAYPDTLFTGEVRQIRLQPVVNQNVVSYDVVIAVPNPLLRLMPGMTANLTIAVARKENVLKVAAAALRFAPPDAPSQRGRKRDRDAADSGKPGRGADKGEGTAAMDSGAARGQEFADSARAVSPGRGHGEGGGDSASMASPDTHNSGGWAGQKRDRAKGRVYILTMGRPTPVEVRVGMSDGSQTEIEANLEAGMEVITGMEAAKGGAAAQSSAPFGMTRSGGRGGGRVH